MKTAAWLAGSFFCAVAIANPAMPSRTPVLLELFTSEGCSSCPPADRLLRLFDEKQPVPGLELIVLSEHVDYWNQLGWKDPWSSAEFTARQKGYVKHFGIDGPYTPQLVIDGAAQVVGGDRPAAEAAMKAAASRPQIGLAVSGLQVIGRKVRFHLDASPPAGIASRSAQIFVAIALDSARSSVARGENAGRVLAHTAVALRIEALARIDPRQALSRDFELDSGAVPPNGRVIVFVQEENFGRVLGAVRAGFRAGRVRPRQALLPARHSLLR